MGDGGSAASAGTLYVDASVNAEHRSRAPCRGCWVFFVFVFLLDNSQHERFSSRPHDHKINGEMAANNETS